MTLDEFLPYCHPPLAVPAGQLAFARDLWRLATAVERDRVAMLVRGFADPPSPLEALELGEAPAPELGRWVGRGGGRRYVLDAGRLEEQIRRGDEGEWVRFTGGEGGG